MRAIPVDGTFSFVIVDGVSGTFSPASNLLSVYAHDYANATVGTFESHTGKTSDVGDIELVPPPLGFVPCLGLLDDQCSALDFSAYHYGIDARTEFSVPDSGQLILGVNSVTDPDWSGQHGQAGCYTLLVAEPEPPIGGIMGRLVDAVSDDPLVAGPPRWPYVTLYRCSDGACNTGSPSRNLSAGSGCGRCYAIQRSFKLEPAVLCNQAATGIQRF